MWVWVWVWVLVWVWVWVCVLCVCVCVCVCVSECVCVCVCCLPGGGRGRGRRRARRTRTPAATAPAPSRSPVLFLLKSLHAYQLVLPLAKSGHCVVHKLLKDGGELEKLSTPYTSRDSASTVAETCVSCFAFRVPFVLFPGFGFSM